MAATSKGNVREAILVAAREAAMAYGYGGLNFRDLAETVGIKAASINYHFATKAQLGDWEDIARDLEAISTNARSPTEALRRYPSIFRLSLERGNRMCLSSFMATEHDELPEPVLKEVQTFADVNTAWLCEHSVAAKLASPAEGESTARAIYAAVAGAQIIARSRSDVQVFDKLIESYQRMGLLPS
jgi:TetR/AcrR family transcriptional regulator, transcriptional repressor for nem operon